MKITITEEDIQKGDPFECKKCPVARAMKRNGLKGVEVGNSTISLLLDGAEMSIQTPIRVAGFIDLFDSGKPVKPFSFNLKLPK